MRAVVCGWLVVWASALLVWRYFAAVHHEQSTRQAALDRREASLEVWSAELGAVDEAGTIHAREIAASSLLDRALGEAPPQTEVAL